MSSSQIPVSGIILIMSCRKYQQTRPINHINHIYYRSIGWPVVVVYGEPILDVEYQFDSQDKNISTLVVRAPDTYLHLILKLGRALDALMKLFDIRVGVLRIVDNNHLHDIPTAKFLLAQSQQSPDYIGCYMNQGRSVGDEYVDTFMLDYYQHHPDPTVDVGKLAKFTKLRTVEYAVGPAFYLSLNACRIILRELDSVGWDVFAEIDGIHPLIIEDYGVGYVLYRNGVKCTFAPKMCRNIRSHKPIEHERTKNIMAVRVPRR
jgi:hypothetical protein